MGTLYRDMTAEERQDTLFALTDMTPEAFKIVERGDAADLMASSPVWQDRYFAASSKNTPQDYLRHLGNADLDPSVRATANLTLNAIRAEQAGGSVLAAFVQEGLEARPGERSAELDAAAVHLAPAHKLMRPFLDDKKPASSIEKQEYLINVLQSEHAPSQFAYETVMKHKKELADACGTDSKTLRPRKEAMLSAMHSATARAMPHMDKFMAGQLQRAGSELDARIADIEPVRKRAGKRRFPKSGGDGSRKSATKLTPSGPVKVTNADQGPARIDRHDIDALREKMPELLEARLGITNLSKNMCCPSPGHEDESPSAHYYAKNNTVHCFGCGKTWDAFQLIGELDGIEKFPDQAKALAEEVGYELASEKPPAQAAGDKPGQGRRLPMPTKSPEEVARRMVSGDVAGARRTSKAAQRHPGVKVNRMTR